jgi:HAE1 family hydrophobic/amphiphilic exporter-1
LNEKLSVIEERGFLVVPPPPIQGIGNARRLCDAGAAPGRQFRFSKLQAIAGAIVSNASDAIARLQRYSPFRSMVPQLRRRGDRVKAQTMHVTSDQIFSTLSSYMGRATSTSSTSSAAPSRSPRQATRNSPDPRDIES